MLPALSQRDVTVARYSLDRDIEYHRKIDVDKAEMENRVRAWTQEVGTNPPWWMVDKRSPPNPHGYPFTLVWPIENQKRKDEMRKKGKPAPKL